MKMDLQKGPDEEGLGVFKESLQSDDRDFNNMLGRWPELFVESKDLVPDATVLTEDYEDLPDLNPVTRAITNARILIRKGGIPVAMGWSAIKAVGVGKGAYELCPGDDVQVKTIAAGVAVATMLVGSPTFVGPVLFLAKKHGLKAWKSITSPKP